MVEGMASITPQSGGTGSPNGILATAVRQLRRCCTWRQTDKYFLIQVSGYFFFFLAILTSIIWLVNIFKYLEFVLENSRAGGDFFWLAVLQLPKTLEIGIPVAGFAAAVALTNRLFNDSELVAMMGAGISGMSLMRPFVVVGAFCFLAVSFIGHHLYPIVHESFERLEDRIQGQYLVQIIKEGEFVFPDPDSVLFFGSIDEDGHMTDILVSEHLDGGWTLIHTAPRGRLVTEGDKPGLLLENGVIQRLDPETRTLGTAHFDRLNYGLRRYANDDAQRTRSLRDMPTLEILGNLGTPNDRRWATLAVVEINERIVKAALSFLAPLIGISALLASSFSRSGFLFRIAVAVILMVLINLLRGVIESGVQSQPTMWPLLYAPVVVGAATVFALCMIGASRWHTSWGRVEERLARVAAK